MMWNWLVIGLATRRRWCSTTAARSIRDGAVLCDWRGRSGSPSSAPAPSTSTRCEKAGLQPREPRLSARCATMLSTGSPLLPESFDYVYEHVKRDVQLASISGGTDIISCFVARQPDRPGATAARSRCAGLGMAVEVLDEEGHRSRARRASWSAPGRSRRCRSVLERPGRQRYRAAYFARFPASGATATTPS